MVSPISQSTFLQPGFLFPLDNGVNQAQPAASADQPAAVAQAPGESGEPVSKRQKLQGDGQEARFAQIDEKYRSVFLKSLTKLITESEQLLFQHNQQTAELQKNITAHHNWQLEVQDFRNRNKEEYLQNTKNLVRLQGELNELQNEVDQLYKLKMQLINKCSSFIPSLILVDKTKRDEACLPFKKIQIEGIRTNMLIGPKEIAIETKKNEMTPLHASIQNYDKFLLNFSTSTEYINFNSSQLNNIRYEIVQLTHQLSVYRSAKSALENRENTQFAFERDLAANVSQQSHVALNLQQMVAANQAAAAVERQGDFAQQQQAQAAQQQPMDGSSSQQAQADLQKLNKKRKFDETESSSSGSSSDSDEFVDIIN